MSTPDDATGTDPVLEASRLLRAEATATRERLSRLLDVLDQAIARYEQRKVKRNE